MSGNGHYKLGQSGWPFACDVRFGFSSPLCVHLTQLVAIGFLQRSGIAHRAIDNYQKTYDQTAKPTSPITTINSCWGAQRRVVVVIAVRFHLASPWTFLPAETNTAAEEPDRP
jgi:hypothetical protein